MASLSLNPQFETNLMSNRNVIELFQLKSAKAHGKNCVRVKARLVRHLLRHRLSRLLLMLSTEHTLLCMFLNIWHQVLFPEDLHYAAL